MKNKIAAVLLFNLFVLSFANKVQAQQQEVATTIFYKDSLFWKAYNSCDIPGMKRYFTEDVEFYHDKGGITMGLEALTATMQKSLCGNAGYRLRREAVPGTVRVFPMHSNGVAYGAIISGDHRFYITNEGKPEFLDGLAKFSQLWLWKDGEWKMSRVLSYDHGPAQRTK